MHRSSEAHAKWLQHVKRHPAAWKAYLEKGRIRSHNWCLANRERKLASEKKRDRKKYYADYRKKNRRRIREYMEKRYRAAQKSRVIAKREAQAEKIRATEIEANRLEHQAFRRRLAEVEERWVLIAS